MNLLIVNYHYFGDQKFNSGIYPTSAAVFVKQLETIALNNYTFISQLELIEILNANVYPDGNYCLITFDDGLKQQFDAFMLLKGKGIPAVFYVPTKPIAEECVLDVHKLHWIRTKVDDLKMLELLKQHKIDTNLTENERQGAKAQYKYDEFAAANLKYLLNFKLSNEIKSYFLNSVFVQEFGSESKFSKEFYFDESELLQLSDAGCLGSHGYSHSPLLQMEEPVEDILKSKDHLYKICGVPPCSFSYPYGSSSAVDANIAEMTKNAGFKFGLTMWRGINDNLDMQNNRYLLKRIDTNDLDKFINK